MAQSREGSWGFRVESAEICGLGEDAYYLLLLLVLVLREKNSFFCTRRRIIEEEEIRFCLIRSVCSAKTLSWLLSQALYLPVVRVAVYSVFAALLIKLL